MSRCEQIRCPDCGDLMIHQSRRGADESSSRIGQYVHDLPALHPVRKRDDPDFRAFSWVDIDGVIFKRETNVLRVIEHKRGDGDQLSRAQGEVLPILAALINGAAAFDVLHHESGVFVLTMGEFTEREKDGRMLIDGETAHVRQVGGPLNEELTGERLRRFVGGYPLGMNR